MPAAKFIARTGRARRYGLTVLAALFISFNLVSCKKPLPPPRVVRVLFVGNSLTSMNDLPGLTAKLARSRNIIMNSVMYAPGGYTLAQHSADAKLLALIQDGGWDYVVLQEQSQLPAFPSARTQVLPYARTLSQFIHSEAPKAKVLFYMTMARTGGDKENARYFPEVGTYEGMQEKINGTYSEMARQNQGVIVPVGEIWRKVRARHPELNLYSDEVHPNLTGTYLAACVFYTVMFGDSPAGLPHPEEIDAAAAAELQQAAGEVLRQVL